MNDCGVALGNVTVPQRTARLRKYVFEIAIVFLAYVVAGKLGQATARIRSSNLGPVWPAYGVAVAAMLICGYRVWLAVAAGAFLVAFFSPVPHIAALGQAAGATLAATTAAFLLHHVAHFRPTLSRISDALTLIALGGFGSAIVSASLGVTVLYATHVHAYSGLGAAWLIYWLGDATGVLLVTPLALMFADFLKLRDWRRITELFILLLLLTITCLIVFSDHPLIPVRLHFMAFAVLPFVIWAAIDFGMSGTTLSVFIVATIATLATAYGLGPFAQDTPFKNAVLLDVFFVVLSVSGMALAAVVSERENLLRQQAAMEAQLRVAEAVRESEERLHLAVQAGRMYAYEWNVATDVVVRSREYMNILGLKTEPIQLTRQQLLENVHPDDRPKFIAAVANLTPENPNTQLTYRVLRPDGSVIWLEKNSHAFFDQNGNMAKVIGMVADVTERKLAEDALTSLSGRLIEAQEEERRRIARELHDDYNQRLAMLAIDLEKLAENIDDSSPGAAEQLHELFNLVSEVGADLHSLSHSLHSSTLESLGLVAGVNAFCKEFAAQQGVQIDFAHENVPRGVPDDATLCLFRITQEALRNVKRHSGAARAEVRLKWLGEELHLSVSDRGSGFNPNSPLSQCGIGIRSMEERLRPFGGRLEINSRPSEGTTVDAWLPFKVGRGLGGVAALGPT